MLNNCRYVRNNVLPKLVDSFRNNDYPIGDKLKKVTSSCNIFNKVVQFFIVNYFTLQLTVETVQSAADNDHLLSSFAINNIHEKISLF